MFPACCSRLTRITLTASCIAASFAVAGHAQTVQVFDEAPPIEVLRSIMVPESAPGASRSIVIQRPNTSPASSSVQQVSTQEPSAQPRAPAAKAYAAARPTEAQAPTPKPSTAPKPAAVGFHINFAFDSAVLPASAHEMVDTVAEVMRDAPDIKVRIEGHTDAAGAPKYNVDLSERRALAVGTYLVKHGIDPARLELVGKGMAEPLTKNPYDAQNRRVQFVRIG